MIIINGYMDEPHVTSQQERNANIATFGAASYILDVGSKMVATAVSANEVQIADGQLMCEGCMAEVPLGTTESLAIDNGTQGAQRIDLIVARYTKAAGTRIEDMQLTVVKGTPAESNPAVPEYNTGSIADGDTPVDFPIYQVNIDGISITSVDALVDTVSIPGMIKNIKDAIDDFMTTKGLSISYSWNRYCTAEGITSCYAYKKNGMLWFRGNISLSTPMPTNTDSVIVARITGWKGVLSAFENVSMRDRSAVMSVAITDEGLVQLSNYSGATASSSLRFTVAVPCENGYE